MSLFDKLKETAFRENGEQFSAVFALPDKNSEFPDEIMVSSNEQAFLKKNEVFRRDIGDGSFLVYRAVSEPKLNGNFYRVFARPFTESASVNILGTEYTITVKKYDEDEAFERRSIDGYCDSWTKQIVVCDMSTYKGWEHEPPETIAAAQKETIRHEIVHAFFGESGLGDSALSPDVAWPKNEELVDWIAIQGPKIWKAWQEVGAV